MPKKTYEPYLLPSKFNDMESHIVNNKVILMEQVVSGINHALSKKLKFVEIFKFSNSDFVITLGSDKFKENITNIFDYYIKNEKYELCERVKKLEKKFNTYEQKKQKEKSI
jgi:hypothetical protein